MILEASHSCDRLTCPVRFVLYGWNQIGGGGDWCHLLEASPWSGGTGCLVENEVFGACGVTFKFIPINNGNFGLIWGFNALAPEIQFVFLRQQVLDFSVPEATSHLHYSIPVNPHISSLIKAIGLTAQGHLGCPCPASTLFFCIICTIKNPFSPIPDLESTWRRQIHGHGQIPHTLPWTWPPLSPPPWVTNWNELAWSLLKKKVTAPGSGAAEREHGLCIWEEKKAMSLNPKHFMVKTPTISLREARDSCRSSLHVQPHLAKVKESTQVEVLGVLRATSHDRRPSRQDWNGDGTSGWCPNVSMLGSPITGFGNSYLMLLGQWDSVCVRVHPGFNERIPGEICSSAVSHFNASLSILCVPRRTGNLLSRAWYCKTWSNSWEVLSIRNPQKSLCASQHQINRESYSKVCKPKQGSNPSQPLPCVICILLCLTPDHSF